MTCSLPDTPQMVELKILWLDQTTGDCDRVGLLIDALADPATAPAEASENLYRIFHDMQGQAGVFGYPLLAALGSKFCAFWRGVKAKEAPAAHDLSVARAHLLAAKFILERKLEGSGGTAGTTIMAKLDAIVSTNT